VSSEKHKKSLLGGIERLLGNSPNSDEVLAAGGTSKALMVLYQADIIDEELAIQWGTHVSKKYVDKDVSKKVRKSAEAFVAVSCFQSVLVKTDDVVAPDCRG
jgi:translation initiation factor 5